MNKTWDGWSKKEISLLKDKYPISSTKKILSFFPKRTYQSIRAKVTRLRLKKIKYLKYTRVWSSDEINILLRNYEYANMSDLLNSLPNKTISTIQKMTKKLGLRRIKKGNNSWSGWELKYLRGNYHNKTAKEISNKLNTKSVYSIHTKASRMGLSEITKNTNKKFSLRRNSKEIIKRDDYKCFICSNYNCSLNVHHIDKNRKNNNILNLITLCPICHMNCHATKKYDDLLKRKLRYERGVLSV